MADEKKPTDGKSVTRSHKGKRPTPKMEPNPKLIGRSIVPAGPARPGH